jgi:hypothetical protein
LAMKRDAGMLQVGVVRGFHAGCRVAKWKPRWLYVRIDEDVVVGTCFSIAKGILFCRGFPCCRLRVRVLHRLSRQTGFCEYPQGVVFEVYNKHK